MNFPLLCERATTCRQICYAGAGNKFGAIADLVVETLHDGGHMVDLTGSVSVSRPGVRIVSDYVVRSE